MTLAKGDVVIIKGEEKNRGLWKLGIVKELITGPDRVVRGAKLRGIAQNAYSRDIYFQFNKVCRSVIAQNAYCSRDTYFQFNKVCRSVISCKNPMKAPQRLVALNALGCSLI